MISGIRIETQPSEATRNREMLPEASGLMRTDFDLVAAMGDLVPYLGNQARLDFVLTGIPAYCRAVASAPRLSSDLCAALAELADDLSIVALLENHDAPIPTFSLIRILERFPRSDVIFRAMEARPDSDFPVWQALATARIEAALSGLTHAPGPDDIERAQMDLLADASPEAVQFYCHHFLVMQQVTGTLLLRAVLSGQTDVFCTFLSQISGYSTELVSHLLTPLQKDSFLELTQRCGMAPEQTRLIIMALEVSAIMAAGEARALKGPLLNGVSRMQRLLAFSQARSDLELRRFMNRLRREAETGLPFPGLGGRIPDETAPFIANQSAEESRFAA